jgi:uncharacterized membrane protein
MSFLKSVFSRLVTGFLFLIPIAIMALILREVLRLVVKLLRPIAVLLPDWLAWPGEGYGVAFLLLIAIALLAGLLAGTSLGQSVTRGLERLVLGKVPGYTLIKSLALGTVGKTTDDDVKVVLVTLDDAWLFGFLIERQADGMLTVFVPSAPSPTSGSLYFFRDDQVRFTDLKVGAAMRIITRLGVGSRGLFEGRMRAIIEQKAVPPAGGTAPLR